MISPDQLKLWKKAAERATPGPWHKVSSLPVYAVSAQGEWGVWDVVTATGREYARHAHHDKHGSKEEDAEFIALSRIAVPELIAEVERLAKENDRYRSENKVYNEQFLKDKTENERLNSVIVSMANGRSEFRNALREARAEIERLRSGYLTDEQGNEYVQVCILKDEIHYYQWKIREQEVEIGRLRAALGEDPEGL